MRTVKSRPSRARGLKHLFSSPILLFQRSRPSRARGLKHAVPRPIEWIIGSRPSRARGLKLFKCELRTLIIVAPLTGARIETPRNCGSKLEAVSRPSRARGLKRTPHRRRRHGARVAPLTGARIETARTRSILGSHLVAPLTGARIETRHAHRTPRLACRAPHGRAD